MRTLVVGSVGLVLVACGGDAGDGAGRSYGPKPANADVRTPDPGNQIEPPQAGVDPSISASATQSPSEGGAPAASIPSENQSRPMQSRQ